MAVITTNIAELVALDLDHVLMEELGTLDYETLVNSIYDVKSSEKKYEYGQTVTGFPIASVKDEGEALTARDWAEGYKTTYTHKTLGMYNAISMEARQDELHGCVEQISPAMARAIDATINYYASRLFSRATNTTEDFVTGGDGVALLSASHPLQAGGTSSNTPSSAVDLTATSLWAGVNAFYEMLDDQAKPVRNRPDRLLIPHQSQQKATELLSSELYPEDANNAINALRKRYEIAPIIWPYWIGSVDDDCWFLLSAKDQWPKDKYPLKFYWRMRLQTDSYNDFYTKDFLYSSVLRFSLGFTDWRFVYGSMGN